MIENENAKNLGRRLGQLSESRIHVGTIATLLNYIPSELKKNMVAAYNCVMSPNIIDERTVDNARHLVSIMDRYLEDEDVAFQLPGWLNYNSSSQFTEDFIELHGFLDGLKQTFDGTFGMSL